MVDMVEVVEDDSSDFTEILASFGVTIGPKPAVVAKAAPVWDDNYDWLTQSS